MDRRRCARCGRNRLLKSFKTRNKAKGLLQSWCVDCRKEFDAERYLTYGERKRQFNKSKEIRARNTNFICEYLSTKSCVVCGNSNILSLEFDHVRGVKEFNISESGSFSIDTLRAEIDKCDVKCANCHRIKTARERDTARHKYYLRGII